ncbi:hypothetical protein AGMMS49959_07460 [Planctomycetales bacterium]|nr:hypothetical protein AGMMS49959_07460 [Planctomycetales bacterium]
MEATNLSKVIHMRRYGKIFIVVMVLLAGLTAAHGADGGGNGGTELSLDTLVDTYIDEAIKWESKIFEDAKFLFWALAFISFFFTVIPLMVGVSKGDSGSIFTPLVQWILSVGIFWFFMLNGAALSELILASFLKMSEEMGDGSVSPMQVMSGVFSIWDSFFNFTGAMNTGFDKLLDSHLSSTEDPSLFESVAYIGRLVKDVASLTVEIIEFAIIMALVSIILFFTCVGITIMICLVAGKLAVRMIAAYLCAYLGCFYLAFGGASFTRDMAIHYFKTILGVAMNLMATILIIGLGINIINKLIALMNDNMKSLAIQVGKDFGAGQIGGLLSVIVLGRVHFNCRSSSQIIVNITKAE